jgi:hypothetical protein
MKLNLAVFVRRISRAALLGAVIAFVTASSWTAANASGIFSDLPADLNAASYGVLGPSSFIGEHDVSMLFTASGGGDVSQIDIALNLLSGTDAGTVSLSNDVGGALGTTLGSWSFTPPSAGTATISGISGVNLVAGTSYFLTASVAGDAFDSWRVSDTVGGETILGGEVDYGPLGAFDILGADVAATPLPATLPLFAGGLGFVGYLARRRKRSSRPAFAAA